MAGQGECRNHCVLIKNNPNNVAFIYELCMFLRVWMFLILCHIVSLYASLTRWNKYYYELIDLFLQVNFIISLMSLGIQGIYHNPKVCSIFFIQFKVVMHYMLQKK